mgnify:CR=1 FL=1
MPQSSVWPRERHVGARRGDSRDYRSRSLRLAGRREPCPQLSQRVLRRDDGRPHSLVSRVDDGEQRHERPPRARLLAQVVEDEHLARGVPLERPPARASSVEGLPDVREDRDSGGEDGPQATVRGGDRDRRGVVGLPRADRTVDEEPVRGGPGDRVRIGDALGLGRRRTAEPERDARPIEPSLPLHRPLFQDPLLLLHPLVHGPVAFAGLVRHPGDAAEDGDSERSERPPAVRAPHGRRCLPCEAPCNRLLGRHEYLRARLPSVMSRVRVEIAYRAHDARPL